MEKEVDGIKVCWVKGGILRQLGFWGVTSIYTISMFFKNIAHYLNDSYTKRFN